MFEEAQEVLADPAALALLDQTHAAASWDRRLFAKDRLQGAGRFLYKYRPIRNDGDESRLADLLVRSIFYLANSLTFNDPFDGMARVIVHGTLQEKRARFGQMINRHVHGWAKQRHALDKFMALGPDEHLRRYEEAVRRSRERLGFYCLAGDGRSTLMWSHYADNHRGVCLRFTVANDVRTFVAAAPVEYSDEYPVLNWVDPDHRQISRAILRKATAWAYEKERRIFNPDGANKVLSFAPRALTAIILGCRMQDDERARLRNVLAVRTAAGHPSPTLYQAKVDGFRYRVATFPVTLV